MRKRITSMPASLLRGVVSCFGIGVLTLLPAAAQTGATPAPAQFGADRQVATASGVRLVGNAFIRRPELTVTADAIGLDYSEKAIKEVRARGKVFFRVSLPPRGGGAPALLRRVVPRPISTRTRARWC
jgi:lipopolysaccharide export system protein LptA